MDSLSLSGNITNDLKYFCISDTSCSIKKSHNTVVLKSDYNRIENNEIKDDGIQDDEIKDDGIQDDEIKDDGIRDDEIEDDEIEDDGIEDNEIEDDEIEDNEIEDDEIEDNEIEDDEIEDDETMTWEEIQNRVKYILNIIQELEELRNNDRKHPIT
jgi:hypothetical protein